MCILIIIFLLNFGSKRYNISYTITTNGCKISMKGKHNMPKYCLKDVFASITGCINANNKNSATSCLLRVLLFCNEDCCVELYTDNIIYNSASYIENEHLIFTAGKMNQLKIFKINKFETKGDKIFLQVNDNTDIIICT